nr:hypothetical protein [Tanacetum cinerariifolium]
AVEEWGRRVVESGVVDLVDLEEGMFLGFVEKFFGGGGGDGGGGGGGRRWGGEANMVPVVVLEVWWWQRGCEVAAAVVGWCRGWR